MCRLVVVLLAASLAACSSGEVSKETASNASARPVAPPPPPMFGPLHGAPPPTAELLSEIDDLSRDLRAVGDGAAQGVADFTDDLANLIADSPPEATLTPFGRSIIGAVQGHKLDPAKATRLAELLYIALNTADLNPQQRATLKAELSALLKEMGASADRVAVVEATLAKLG